MCLLLSSHSNWADRATLTPPSAVFLFPTGKYRFVAREDEQGFPLTSHIQMAGRGGSRQLGNGVFICLKQLGRTPGMV